jgi:hypothetical protein
MTSHLSRLATHPKGLRLPRVLLRAATGMMYGTRGGNNFRKATETELNGGAVQVREST